MKSYKTGKRVEGEKANRYAGGGRGAGPQAIGKRRADKRSIMTLGERRNPLANISRKKGTKVMFPGFFLWNGYACGKKRKILEEGGCLRISIAGQPVAWKTVTYRK